MEKELNDEMYEKLRERMKDFSVDDLKRVREELIKKGQMDNQMLALFNDELLDRIHLEDKGKSK